MLLHIVAIYFSVVMQQFLEEHGIASKVILDAAIGSVLQPHPLIYSITL